MSVSLAFWRWRASRLIRGYNRVCSEELREANTLVPYCVIALLREANTLVPLRFRHSPNGFRFAPTSLIGNSKFAVQRSMLNVRCSYSFVWFASFDAKQLPVGLLPDTPGRRACLKRGHFVTLTSC